MGEGDRVTGPSRKTQPSPVTTLNEHTLSRILVEALTGSLTSTL